MHNKSILLYNSLIAIGHWPLDMQTFEYLRIVYDLIRIAINSHISKYYQKCIDVSNFDTVQTGMNEWINEATKGGEGRNGRKKIDA